ncbi:MAG: hypothetical protein WBL06_01270 [Pseudolysinimonas sp.]|uniref:hypothetical protein n=1 Tax=Pseudolysinimonas sp. TaxID=2680009 RepID=UPI003C7624DC
MSATYRELHLALLEPELGEFHALNEFDDRRKLLEIWIHEKGALPLSGALDRERRSYLKATNMFR